MGKFQHSTPSGSSKVQQGAEKEANINNIAARFQRTGVLVGPQGKGEPRKPMWGDFSCIDYREALQQVMDIKTMFNRLPARIRAQFNGDPAEVMRFVNDPANRKEAIKLKLLVPTLEEVEKDQEELERAQAKAQREEAEKAGQTTLVKADEEAQPQHRK